MAGMAADPWGDESEQTAPTTTPTVEIVSDDTDEVPLLCPHCGTPLTPHNDIIGSLHCYDPRCSQCCFWPPDSESEGQPKLKLEQHPCKMAQKVGAF